MEGNKAKIGLFFMEQTFEQAVLKRAEKEYFKYVVILYCRAHYQEFSQTKHTYGYKLQAQYSIV